MKNSKKISVCLLSFMVVFSLMAPVANASEIQPNNDVKENAEQNIKNDSKSNIERPKTIFGNVQGSGLEIGPEIIGDVAKSVGKLNPPEITGTIKSGDTEIKGSKGEGSKKIIVTKCRDLKLP